MANKGRLLIVDDEVELMRALCDSLGEQGYVTHGLPGPQQALELLRDGEFDILLTDLMMPKLDGIQLLKQALTYDPHLVGIIMTGQGTIPTAVEAMKSGAFDYILKPFRLQHILPVLERAMEVRRLRLENQRLRRYLKSLTFESERYRLVGSSEAMQRVLQLIERVAPTDATVLIRGPSGTGKELVARAIHANSRRRDSPFIAINCATLQESLLESELFGHEKGAFTGADRAKPGLFEVADGGTLFVDEVAEMSPALQAKLLRVLENGHYRRLGSTQDRYANVRILAATNKPLEEEVRAGRFRDDLYYRLNVITLTLPPLRERRQDIPELVTHFLTTRSIARAPLSISPEALDILLRYDWPGNVRELANVLERAQILAEGNMILPTDLPENLVAAARQSVAGSLGPAAGPTMPGNPADAATTRNTPPSLSRSLSSPVGVTHDCSLAAVERRHILDVLQRCNGNKVHAARLLGVSRRTLYRLLDKHQLRTSERRRDTTSEASPPTPSATSDPSGGTPTPPS
ncbi:MAG: sigma-54 dependent transcriptional regulator [Gemmataceae bacterium]|nr:sigma-54 dependent transcriptional regulator [Gemmataceae bacterium]MCS7269588.1 sigma-54 dependent transcriptional regulator [Gemmataceae bacterium]MDW8244383.1 sigma-54 dependent transcriptional regulator [Thermogemmata sp.]